MLAKKLRLHFHYRTCLKTSSLCAGIRLYHMSCSISSTVPVLYNGKLLLFIRKVNAKARHLCFLLALKRCLDAGKVYGCFILDES